MWTHLFLDTLDRHVANKNRPPVPISSRFVLRDIFLRIALSPLGGGLERLVDELGFTVGVVLLLSLGLRLLLGVLGVLGLLLFKLLALVSRLLLSIGAFLALRVLGVLLIVVGRLRLRLDGLRLDLGPLRRRGIRSCERSLYVSFLYSDSCSCGRTEAFALKAHTASADHKYSQQH